MFKEFKAFIMRGNVLDMAVGVIIGGAFTTIVTSFTKGIITPIIAVVTKLLAQIFHGGKPLQTNSLDFSIIGITFEVGTVVTAIFTFLITAFVLFMIIRAVNKANALTQKKTPEEETPAAPTAEDYLKEIRDLLAQQKK